MKYFLDSSFIIALINDNDSLHEKAIEYLDLTEKNECYISNLIINEVITVIGNKLGLKIAISTYNILINIFHVVNEYENNDFNSENMMIYEKYDTKLSFTDTSIIYIMKKSNIDNLISFDKEFRRVKEINLIGL